MGLGVRGQADNKIGSDDGQRIKLTIFSPPTVKTNDYIVEFPAGYNRIVADYDDDVYGVYGTQYVNGKWINIGSIGFLSSGRAETLQGQKVKLGCRSNTTPGQTKSGSARILIYKA